MAYGQRDKFIQAVVTFTTSDRAKEMSPIELQGLLAKIRDRYSPDVSNDDWGEIAQGVNDFKFVITDSVKYKEVPNIEDQLPGSEVAQPQPTEEPEIAEDEIGSEDTIVGVSEEKDITAEQIEKTPEIYNEPEQNQEDGETLEDDFEEEQREKEPEPAKPEKFGRFIKPKENKPIKVNTTRLKGLLKPKKTND